MGWDVGVDDWMELYWNIQLPRCLLRLKRDENCEGIVTFLWTYIMLCLIETSSKRRVQQPDVVLLRIPINDSFLVPVFVFLFSYLNPTKVIQCLEV